ncbi:MAG: hypothetical protein ACLS6O_04180 [Bifidobacterium sp.]
MSDEALNLNQPVKDMGPNELKAYARLGKQQHDEANRELNAVGAAMMTCCQTTSSCQLSTRLRDKTHFTVYDS